MADNNSQGKRKLESTSSTNNLDQPIKKKLNNDVNKEKLRKEFSAANIELMHEKRTMMDNQELIWALFSFNNVENQFGANGGVYEILENEEIIYISGLPKEIHIRDALNAHFSGHDKLPLGKYLSRMPSKNWREFQVRFMLSDAPRDDARLLLRHYQLTNKGKIPKFN